MARAHVRKWGNSLGIITEDFVIPDTTIAEFAWVLLRDFSEEEANNWVEKLSPYSEQVTRDVLLESIRFRFARRKRDISFFDAVGYVFARKKPSVLRDWRQGIQRASRR